jgi:hypothetical protein
LQNENINVLGFKKRESISLAQGELQKMKIFHQQTEMKFKVRTSRGLRWGHSIYGAENWALRESK